MQWFDRNTKQHGNLGFYLGEADGQVLENVFIDIRNICAELSNDINLRIS